MSHQQQNPPAANDVPQTRSDIDLEIDLELFERRSSIRRIPCPDAVERDDEAVWTDWDLLTGS
jgi:hypothetical protein